MPVISQLILRGKSPRIARNSGILPDMSSRLPSLLVFPVRARCPLDLTAMMAALRFSRGQDCAAVYAWPMKSFFIFSLVCVVAVLGQAPTDESAAVLQAEHDGYAAYLRGDAEKIANFLTDDYTLTNSKGEISTAADDIEDARSGRVHYDVFENYDMKVRVYGGHTAIVTGKTKVKGNAQGKPIDIIVQFTDTFVKQSGRWRLAAGHVSRLKD
jgi:ketosteroid isomerase-like protein